MAGLWPTLRRFGSDVRKFAESDKMDEVLKLGLFGTMIWSGVRMKRRIDAAKAEYAAEEAAEEAAEIAEAAAAAAIRNK